MLATLAGCAKKAEPISMGSNFSVNCDAEYDGFKASMYITRLGADGWEVTFTSPETLKGLAVSYENENTKVSYKGLTFSVPREDVPVNALVTNITGAMNNMGKKNNVEFTKKNGIVTAKGNIDSGNYVLKCNQKDGAPMCLEIKKIKLKADFSDFKLMQ